MLHVGKQCLSLCFYCQRHYLSLLITAFHCGSTVENPQTGMLKERGFMKGRPCQDVSYCLYGAKVQKHTRLWTDGPCFGARKCERVPNKPCGDHWTCGLVGKHERATGGTKGVPGQRKEKRSSIPSKLIEEMYGAYFG